MADEQAMLQRQRHWLNFIVAAAIVFFLARFAYQNWPGGEAVEVRALPLAIACVLMAASLLAGAVIWMLNLRLLGERLVFVDALRAFLFSQLCRYIPGKIWFVLGRAHLGKSYGASGARVAASTAVEFGAYTLSGLAIGAAWLLGSRAATAGVPLAALAVGAAAMLACLHPSVFKSMVGAASRWAGRPPVEMNVRFVNLGLLFLCYLALWGLIGIAFRFLLVALNAPAPDTINCIGLFAAAASIGCLAVFAPAGIGIREAALSAFLVRYMGPPKAVFVSLAARLWIALVEIVVTGLVFAVLRRPREPAP